MDVDLYIISVFFLAALVHGIVGFAFALISTPLLAMVIPFQKAILLTIIPTIWANIFSIYGIRESIIFLKEYIAFFISIIFGSIVGTYLLFIINPQVFTVFLVLLIWGYLYIDYNKNRFKIKEPQGFNWKIIIGLFAGVSAGVGNIMSPVILIYFLSLKKSKLEIVVLSNASFLIAKLVQLSLFIKLMDLSGKYYVLTILILIFIILGLKIGNRIREHKYIVSNYNKIVKLFIFVISIILIIKNFII